MERKNSNIITRCRHPACGNIIRKEYHKIGVTYFDPYYKGKRVDWYHIACYKKMKMK